MKIMNHLSISLALTINILFAGVSIAKEYTTEQIDELHNKAKQGDHTAQIDLGLLYYYGDGVVENK
ncbi:hypothetical protein [uncultured Desulfuromonas sp.]|uniref:hypothetical protein n=1 Tax=uncultured Desulfuromonas sp. TaxID=181013 RepID=UPI002AABB191|nr:hypothetical protein [uncultured Desulfuromonas sp.]